MNKYTACRYQTSYIVDSTNTDLFKFEDIMLSGAEAFGARIDEIFEHIRKSGEIVLDIMSVGPYFVIIAGGEPDETVPGGGLHI